MCERSDLPLECADLSALFILMELSAFPKKRQSGDPDASGPHSKELNLDSGR